MDQLEHDDIIKRKYLARGSGDAATKAYIASKYLSGGKKRKKTHTKNHIGIIDEEDMSWETAGDSQIEERNRKQEQLKLEQDAIQNAGGVFRGTNANWETIQGGNPDEQEDEQPQVLLQDNDAPRMSNGQRAGVLTKAQIKAEAEKARDLETKAMERLSNQEAQDADNTIYRDATGKRVDPKMKRAEEARRRKEQIEKEARKMEWGKGLVQRREAEDERRRLEEEKHKPMARYADDEDLNEELKGKERWNDPAAGFLTKKTNATKGKSSLVRPTYQGAWKPNRFMVPPGYRWDGVDRSTGFEDTFLLQQNQTKSFAAQAHAWSTEDM